MSVDDVPETQRVTEAVLKALYVRQRGLCACGCGRVLGQWFHVDHRVPLSRGGRHERSNVCLMAPACNLRFGAKLKGTI